MLILKKCKSNTHVIIRVSIMYIFKYCYFPYLSILKIYISRKKELDIIFKNYTVITITDISQHSYTFSNILLLCVVLQN